MFGEFSFDKLMSGLSTAGWCNTIDLLHIIGTDFKLLVIPNGLWRDLYDLCGGNEDLTD